MNTLYGQEAKNGDFVLVQDVAYMKGTADIIVAQVHNGKAYAASAVPFKHNSRRWLRKEVAIIVIPITEVTIEEKKLIQMNIEAEKSTFEVGTEYFSTVWKLLHDATVAKQQLQDSKRTGENC